MSDFVLDASLAIQWFLEDEADREYSLKALQQLEQQHAIVPSLWLYEVGNGLLMAHRRKRISVEQLDAYLMRLTKLPINIASNSPKELFDLPHLAQKYGLTNYDAAYLALAMKLGVPLATTDALLKQATIAVGLAPLVV